MKIIKPTEPEKSINQTPDELNNYFNSNTNPMDRQPTVTTPPEANQNPIMKLHSVTAVDLFQAWKTIKNKTNTKEDCNGISLAMLNLIISCPNVYDTIVNLINQSIKSFTFPNALKTSVIAPIPKIPSPSKPSDYRPISVQTNLSKLYEKCVYNQIAIHMMQNNSICPEQFGFRHHHTTEHAMIALTDFLYQKLGEGKFAIVVSLDLQKAFDTVDPEILTTKIRLLGIDERWFESYLSGRQQYVKIKNQISQLKENKIGIPQGTILGPILFSIFINDMPRCLKHSNGYLFADDSNVATAGEI